MEKDEARMISDRVRKANRNPNSNKGLKRILAKNLVERKCIVESCTATALRRSDQLFRCFIHTKHRKNQAALYHKAKKTIKEYERTRRSIGKAAKQKLANEPSVQDKD